MEHRRHVGDVWPEQDLQSLCVDVVQRDEFTVATSPVSIRRTPPMVSLAGIRLSRDETRNLTQLLIEALTMIETPSPGPAELPGDHDHDHDKS